jgi:hypothetical protein
MRAAYVDTSCLVAVAFAEAGSRRVATRLSGFDRLLSSNLLEAELRSALVREKETGDPASLLSGMSWIYPDRALTREFEAVTSLGYLRGADLWHLACALFLAPDPGQISFLTLDKRQKQVASRLGFAV